MKEMINAAFSYGFDFIKNIYLLPWYLKTRNQFIKQNKNAASKHSFDSITWYPVLGDKNACAGTVSTYLLQDLWAAQKISSYPHPYNQLGHYDIGSRVDGFIAYLLSFRGNINLIDIRPLPYSIDDTRLCFIKSDATLLTENENESVYSLSALCSLEHFGLGRYGDPIDASACFKAFDSIQRVMQKNGHIYISVLVGKPQVAFNAHRIFDPFIIKECFDKCELIEFSVITREDPDVPIIVNADMDVYSQVNSVMGLFEFRKL